MFRISVICALAVALAGCGTPDSVLKLAKRTGDNAISLSLDIETLMKNDRALMEQRAAAIGRLASVVSRRKTVFEQQLDIKKEAGYASETALFKKISGKAEKFAKQDAKLAEEIDKKVETLLKDQAKIAAPTKPLREVGKDLLALSKKEDLKKRLKFLAAFTKDVADKVEEARKAGDKAAEAGADKSAANEKASAAKVDTKRLSETKK